MQPSRLRQPREEEPRRFGLSPGETTSERRTKFVFLINEFRFSFLALMIVTPLAGDQTAVPFALLPQCEHKLLPV